MQEANEPSVAYLTAAEHAAKDVAIPEALIYEMVNGKPIYYRGWREVLKNEKTIEQVMASSYIQSFLINEIAFVLNKDGLRKNYIILTNEAGLKFKKGDWRAADIALLLKSVMKGIKLHNHYVEQKPSIIIEVDTKADADNLAAYYKDKTKHLHNEGIQKVIWVFTETEQIMVAEPDKHWEIFDWSETVEVVEGVGFNVAELIADFNEQV